MRLIITLQQKCYFDKWFSLSSKFPLLPVTDISASAYGLKFCADPVLLRHYDTQIYLSSTNRVTSIDLGHIDYHGTNAFKECHLTMVICFCTLCKRRSRWWPVSSAFRPDDITIPRVYETDMK